jgi:D-cysteine desulfhydrase
MTPSRLILAHLPTPVVRDDRLSEMLGVELWIKRDDATGGAEAGNKIRKLEFLLADAIERRAKHIVTCGGLQSNHARATAILARRLGLDATLLLRSERPLQEDDPPTGNLLLDLLVGAHVRVITPEQYKTRDALMAEVAAELGHAYVIPEGGSNGLGALGYVEAMRETRAQADPFDVVVHACGSGGTAAGIALGCAVHGTAGRVLAIAVCDDTAYFERTIARIVAEARALVDLPGPAKLTIDDRFKGPRYGVMSEDQRAYLVACARDAGLILDPVYTGKAMFGLRAAVQRGEIAQGARVLFVHTGGLPGLLADSALGGNLFA